MQTIEDRIISRIYGKGRGSVWTPIHFSDLGERPAVAKALSRLVESERIERIGRGLYHYPQTHPILGRIAPSIDAIANALKGRDQVRLQPSGAYAANLLHLSEQVPARIVFLTDGPARKVEVGKLSIEFKQVAPRRVAAWDRATGLVIEALRELGAERITDGKIQRLSGTLNAKDRKRLIDDLGLAPAWMRPILKAIALGEVPSRSR